MNKSKSLFFKFLVRVKVRNHIATFTSLDHFSQVARRKKVLIQRTYLCLIAASGNLYEDLHNFIFTGDINLY